MPKKRERLEVIRDILNAIRQKRRIKPTRLLFSSNLSPQMFKTYVDELLNKGFIKTEEDKKGKKEFLLDKKGMSFLQEYSVIENFVESFGL